MSNLASFGFWTCAALYAAAGMFGVFILTSQPNVFDLDDGYAIQLVARR